MPSSSQRFAKSIWQTQCGELQLDEAEYPSRLFMPEHVHSEPHFSLIRRGDLQERLARRESQRSAGELIFRPAGTEHSVRFNGTPVRVFRIRFSPAWLERHAFPCASRMRFTSSQSPRDLGLALRIQNETKYRDEYSALAVDSLLLELLIESQRERPGRIRAGETAWLRAVRARLQEEFNVNHSLVELAREADVHPAHLARAFRQKQGCTIGEYLRRLRIEFASRELSNTETPLGEIACKAGFADQSHFTRCFKRGTGLTPLQFRALNRG